MCSKSESTPLHYASRGGYADVVGLLVTKGVLASILTQLLTSSGPVEGAELTSKDAKGFGAIHWAVQSHKVTQAGPRDGSSRSCAQTLNQTPTMKEASVRELIKWKCDLNFRDGDSRTGGGSTLGASAETQDAA